MGAIDLTLAAAILAAAGWLLYRSYRRARGGCCGCSGGCGESPKTDLVSLRRAGGVRSSPGARGRTA
jgi:hypothetical protein